VIRAVAFALALFAASPVAAQPQPSEAPTQVEPPALRPSGFWGTTQRATGGAYRWKLLGIGVVLAAVTGAVMLRLVRRANSQRRTDL
jgi:hypothetical protein